MLSPSSSGGAVGGGAVRVGDLDRHVCGPPTWDMSRTCPGRVLDSTPRLAAPHRQLRLAPQVVVRGELRVIVEDNGNLRGGKVCFQLVAVLVPYYLVHVDTEACS